MKTKQVWMWAGIVDDEPHFYRNMDFYNGIRHLDLFKTKKEARVCYEQVVRVAVKFPRTTEIRKRNGDCLDCDCAKFEDATEER